MDNYLEKYEEWCKNPFFDGETKKELYSIKEDKEEIQDRFYKDLEFGTAGLRGIMGAGTNRMNQYTVGKATQGLSNYLLKKGGKDRGVAIAYDSRNFSKEFGEQTALCLAANGIKAYLFDSLRPVPELSFAIRTLHCMAGIVITASHNPPEYNGYKVYWEDGAQIVSPVDKEIIGEVNSITDYTEIKTMAKEEALEKGLLQMIGKEIDDQYMAELKKLVLNPEIVKEMGKELKIVYTPLHGTGNIPVRRILKEIGFEHVYVVPEQELPDGNFPTVDYPNPEDKKAFKMALELAKKVDADLVLATDPDADRLGIYAKDTKTGEYMEYTGNMSGLLIAEYEFSQMKEKNILPKNGALIKTIVSSNLAEDIASYYGVTIIEVLTGFKYIGEKIKQFEQTKEYQYLFGYEESYGCLIGTHARDKDSVVAVMALCEAAAYYRKQGLTLWDQMIRIYEKYGYYKEGQYSMVLKGADGAEKIKQMMEKVRNNPPKQVGDAKVMVYKDFKLRKAINLATEEEKAIILPESNVLYFELENNEWCCIRPSGTEPKIKLYVGAKGNSMNHAKERYEKLIDAMIHMVEE